MLPQVPYFDRQEFLDSRWLYHAGEHVTFLCPTQGGKTTFMFQLAEVTATPQLPARVLVVKPADPTVSKWGTQLGYKRVQDWPPMQIPFMEKPSGHLIWPKFRFDPKHDDQHIHDVLRKTILSCYRDGMKRKKCIIVADETYSLGKEHKLDREMVTILSKGGGMGIGMWGGTQKPSHIPLWFYSQAEHLFLGNDPDRRSRERYAEIGGVDPKLVAEVTRTLPKYHFLYIRRTGQRLCIVGP